MAWALCPYPWLHVERRDRGPHQLKNAKIDSLILAVLVLLMHRSKGGGIVDASMHRPEVLLMHQSIG